MNGNGSFGFYSLTDWWTNSFTDQEKTRFKELYKPLGGSYEDLFKGSGGYGASVVWFLTTLAGYATNKSDVGIALKFLNKAEEFVGNCTVVDKHFLLNLLIEVHYKLRDDIRHYQKAKKYCAQQISLASETSDFF
ncbi:MAG: hypothetical protein Q7U83_09960 [Daejeonella sp.]|nr:hypothetical protein [Daejeonella sp.]